MGAKSEQGLPAEYQQVEWIGHNNSGSAYINSVSSYANVLRVVMDLEFTAKAQYSAAIVLGNSGPAFPVAASSNPSSLKVPAQRSYDFIPATLVSGAIARNTYTLTKLEGATIPSSFALFGWNNTSWTCGLKAYGAKMYNTSNKMIFDGVPCYRKSDNAIGIFDLIAQKFFAANGTWTKGADVT